MANLIEFTPPPSSPISLQEWYNLASNIKYGVDWAKERYGEYKENRDERRYQESGRQLIEAEKMAAKRSGTKRKAIKSTKTYRKKQKNTSKKNTWRIENSDERAQQEIGYGNYQARNLYTKRPRKGGRAAAWKKFKNKEEEQIEESS